MDRQSGQVSILDIVVMLGRTRRFGGSGSTEYTVLHHSMLVALLWIRAGFPLAELHFPLLHDAHEYVLGDTPGPVKHALRAAQVDGFMGGDPLPRDSMKHLEQVVDERIRKHLGLDDEPGPQTKRRIKICDLAALLVEGVMFGAPGCDCSVDVPDELHDEVYALLDKALPHRFSTATIHQRSPGATRALLSRDKR